MTTESRHHIRSHENERLTTSLACMSSCHGSLEFGVAVIVLNAVKPCQMGLPCMIQRFFLCFTPSPISNLTTVDF